MILDGGEAKSEYFASPFITLHTTRPLLVRCRVAGEDPVLLAEYIDNYANGLQVGEDPRYGALAHAFI